MTWVVIQSFWLSGQWIVVPPAAAKKILGDGLTWIVS